MWILSFMSTFACWCGLVGCADWLTLTFCLCCGLFCRTSTVASGSSSPRTNVVLKQSRTNRDSAMAIWRLPFLSVFLTESFAANLPLIIVPGLTGSGLEVKEHGAPMPHSICRTDTKGKWMKVWVSPALWIAKKCQGGCVVWISTWILSDLPNTKHQNVNKTSTNLMISAFLMCNAVSWFGAKVQVLPEEIDCLLARLTLTYDPVSDTYSHLNQHWFVEWNIWLL